MKAQKLETQVPSVANAQTWIYIIIPQKRQTH